MHEIKRCKKTVMDNISDPDIKFDSNGICNYYYEHQKRIKSRKLPKKENDLELEKIINRIKYEGRKCDYDCIIGVSGGVDSTYTAYLVKKLGLRPLAVHLDNGWNAEIAVKNIKTTLKILNIDLYTKVLDWNKFKNRVPTFNS